MIAFRIEIDKINILEQYSTLQHFYQLCNFSLFPLMLS